jgi:hypothetical protein
MAVASQFDAEIWERWKSFQGQRSLKRCPGKNFQQELARAAGAMLSGLLCGIKVMGDPTPKACEQRANVSR